MSSFVNEKSRLTIWMQTLSTGTFRPSRIRAKGARIETQGRGRHEIRGSQIEAVGRAGVSALATNVSLPVSNQQASWSMSTTQIPPANPASPTRRAEGRNLYDARYWESAYREIRRGSTLLLKLQDELAQARRREAFWISVVVHLIVVLLLVELAEVSRIDASASRSGHEPANRTRRTSPTSNCRPMNKR